MDKFVVRNNPTAPELFVSAASSSGSTSVGNAKRKFNSSWLHDYFVIETRDNKPNCLLCSFTISQSHVFNVKRHFDGNHSDIAAKYPIGSEERKSYIAQLQKELEKQKHSIKQAMSETDIIALASLKVCWKLAINGKSFTDAELFKDILIDAIEIISTGTFAYTSI